MVTEESTGLVDKGWLRDVRGKLKLLAPKNKRHKLVIILVLWFIVLVTNNIWVFLILLGGGVSWVYLTNSPEE